LQLTREFRRENLDTPSDPWLRDVMQTKNTVLYAARGTREQYLRRRMTVHLMETQDSSQQTTSNIEQVDAQVLDMMDVDMQSDNIESAQKNVIQQFCACIRLTDSRV
jgi:hypothetical protein